MSFPVPVLYKALKQIEQARRSGITVGELAESMDISKPRSLIAELLENGFIHVSSDDIQLDTKVTIKNEGVKALLEYGLQIDDEEEPENAADGKDDALSPRFRRGHWLLILIPVVLLLCFLSFFIGAYLYATTNMIDGLIHQFIPVIPAV